MSICRKPSHTGAAADNYPRRARAEPRRHKPRILLPRCRHAIRRPDVAHSGWLVAEASSLGRFDGQSQLLEKGPPRGQV